MGNGLSFVIKALVAGVLVYAAGFLLFVSSLPRKPSGPLHGDAIVALTGGGARLDTAVALFEGGTGKRLLISGVNSITTKAELKKINHGGPRFDCCVDLGRDAADTHGNAIETAQWANAHGYKSLIVVTAGYHMPRSLTEFSSALPDVELVPYPVEPAEINLNVWWKPGTIRLLHGEYARFLASLVTTTMGKPSMQASQDTPSLAAAH
jgi:uncharacterized SAM-binding protein YcdF (DUF218 family)